MAFDNTLIEEIVKRADIVKVISSFINVIKKGKNYVAVCPFHDDTNPSMSISQEKRMFKCFVCGTGGNCIVFVQKYLHISFGEALKKVAELIDFHDPRLEGVVKVKKVDEKAEPMLKCLHDLTLYYQYALNTPEGKDGLDYFESRNLNADLRSKYKLGYAFKDGKATIDFLQKKGHSLKTIEDVGITNLLGGTYSDKNQGRCIFPICDKDGNVIGYSARRIKDGPEAKYVNSPETYLFHKSSVLYNYHIAKEAARIAGCLYICEGFMDVFALAKIGMDNAVAIMGTALTNEHIAMLRAVNVELRLCLDGDLPGQTAMMKASKALEQAGLKFAVVNNQNSTKDPDEILNQDGPDSLRTYLNNTLSRVDFALNYFKNSNPLKSMDQKKKLVSEFIPILLNINSQLELDNYLRKLSAVTGFEVESLRQLLNRAREQAKVGVVDEAKIIRGFSPERTTLRKLFFAERELLYQMVNNPEAMRFYEDKNLGFVDEIYRAIANFVEEFASTHPSYSPDDLIICLQQSDVSNKDELINELTALCFEKNHPTVCDRQLLDSLMASINSEKDRIFEQDSLAQSLEGKDPLEQARILAEHNRKKLKEQEALVKAEENKHGKENS